MDKNYFKRTNKYINFAGFLLAFFSVSDSSVFGMNSRIYKQFSANLHIQSLYEEIQSR